MDEKKLKIDEKPAFRHSIPVQMRFNDVDVLGHVNNSVYFTYYDLGKSAYFTTIRKGELDWMKPDVVVANVNCNFYSRCKSPHVWKASARKVSNFISASSM